MIVKFDRAELGGTTGWIGDRTLGMQRPTPQSLGVVRNTESTNSEMLIYAVNSAKQDGEKCGKRRE